MSAPPDGGPAFPNDNEGDGTMSGGMTLRDYFAAEALKGLLALPQNDGRAWQGIAEEIYAIADAVLAERQRLAEREQ